MGANVLKLTKFMSNAREVLGAFQPEDGAPTVKNLDLFVPVHLLRVMMEVCFLIYME